MNNCDCNPCGQGIVPATVCCKKKEKEPPIKLATVNYPAQYGTDAEGQPYAPQYGKFTNTIVTYAANNARYIYDGQGEYTKIISDDQFNALEQKLIALLNEETEARQSDVENLQTNINAEVNARLALAEGLAEETAERKEADEALSTRIDEVINSPDVRYIVESYADLEAIDKATVGDQDYARVLVDETHDGQSTFYQFNKAGNDWTYVGAAGAYYTKTEVDSIANDLEAQIRQSGGSGKLAAVLNTNTELQALDPTALTEGQVAIVLNDEAHDNATTFYEVGEASGLENLLVGNEWVYYNDPTDRYWDWDSNPDEAILAFTPKSSPAGNGILVLTIARKDMTSGIDFANEDYSIQISALDANTPSSVMITGASGKPGLTVPTDGTNVNIDAAAKNNLWYVTNSNSELVLRIAPATFPNGARLNIRIYKGLNAPEPSQSEGEPTLVWNYVNTVAVPPMQLKTINGESIIGTGDIEITGGGSEVKLYPTFSTQEDGANTAFFMNFKLNSDQLKLGQGVAGNGSSIVALGAYSTASSAYGVAIGANSSALNQYAISLGYMSSASSSGAIAIGGQAASGGTNSVAIGKNSGATWDRAVAIGDSASLANIHCEYGVAIGAGSKVISNCRRSVALGYDSKTSRSDELSIGAGTGDNPTRYIANVTAGELDTDAVNMSQLNALIARVEALEANAS